MNLYQVIASHFRPEKMRVSSVRDVFLTAVLILGLFPLGLGAQQITYKPYIQLGDASRFGATDQIVIAWQTNESSANPGAYLIQYGTDPELEDDAARFHPAGRVVDNYLTADPVFASLVIPTAYGAHVDYYGVITGLRYDTRYYYRVTGPGLPADGFRSSFSTRTQRDHFSFQVQGDEGYYPGIPKTKPTDPSLIANFESRIIHTMFNVDALSLPGQPRLPRPDLALNTGDNVYITGGDSNYRDVWMDTWNSNTDSNETGAPYIRSVPLYIVAGNHDVGSTGATANLLADSGPTVPGFSGPGAFGGGLSGGDALAYFNNYYFPLNGQVGVDIQNRFAGDNSSPGNFFFQYSGFNNGSSYDSPLAIEALRASTAVNTGHGLKRQIDHMSNYSFDYGNAHFVFLDANPHLFDNLLPGDATYQSAPTFPFPAYPSVLRNWLIHDLDSSNRTWKIVVFHQPSFSSGNATLRNDQMRTIAKFLEDHGVNVVFNGHEHNYQRTLPLRALPAATQSPNPSGPPAVVVDSVFDGIHNTVPDGVIYFVEGAGGNRDFDDALGNPRGSSAAVIDQEDSAKGQSVLLQNHTFPNGPASWLDTHLTNTAMTPFFPTAGSGAKITARFKAKVFSFADIIVRGNELTLYQISEPLSQSSSATEANPFPFGTDINGHRLNDPIPDTVLDPVSRTVISAPASGTPALLDKLTVTKPEIGERIRTELSLPEKIQPGGTITCKLVISNNSNLALNGTQAVFTLPDVVHYAGAMAGEEVTSDGADVIVTLGRLSAGDVRAVQISAQLSPQASKDRELTIRAQVRSATAMPVEVDSAKLSEDQ